MWFFKGKNNSQQGDKYASAEQGQNLLKEIKMKLQQKMKKISKNIGDSQLYFQRYSKMERKEEQLIVSFEQMMNTLQGLISIIQQLKKQVQSFSQDLVQSKKLKEMIGNHHNIVSTIQNMHNEQIARIHEQSKNITDELKFQIWQAKLNLQRAQKQKSLILLRLNEIQQVVQKLKVENNCLVGECSDLREKYALKELMCNNIFEKKEQSKKIINVKELKLYRLKQSVFNFLEIKQVVELKKTNKFYRQIVRVNQSQIIYSKLKERFVKSQSRQRKNLKYYQKVIELFPTENIKNTALKYIYFRIKPATYILPYLQQQSQFNEQKQIDSKQVTKNKFNWRQLFSEQKNKKQENKFSVAQLKNAAQFKKIQSKIEGIFSGLMSFKLPEDLIYYSNTMENQLKQMKKNLNQKSSGKQPHLTWTSQLHCLSKFMYLEINELYNLLQVIFSELISKNRDLIFVKEKHDELRQNQRMLRSLIQNISNIKSSLEKKNASIENELIKNNLQKDVLKANCIKTEKQYSQLKTKYDSLSHQYNNAVKTLQSIEEERIMLQNSLISIKEQINKLQEKSKGISNRKQSTASLQEYQ